MQDHSFALRRLDPVDCCGVSQAPAKLAQSSSRGSATGGIPVNIGKDYCVEAESFKNATQWR
jgi:hypothetical protein